jgi:hypothetical protein
MADKEINRRPDRRPDRRVQRSGGDVLKHLWVDRGQRFIDEQRDGIDTWQPDGKRVPVTTLVDAYITISAVLKESDGSDAGRVVEFYMKPRGGEMHEHMASMLYEPPREGRIFRRKRRHLRTNYHV